MALAQPEPTVGEVMLRNPKTLPADVTVSEARAAFENESVKMLLLTHGDRFYGAVTAIPSTADPSEPALGLADESPPIVHRETAISEALDQLESKASGRLIVLDEDRLVGLVCLATDGVTFCGSPPA